MQLYDAQRDRGTDGFGLFDGARCNIAKARTEDQILGYLVSKESDFIMFHHRFPTSTPNTKRTAHPFTTYDYFGDTQYILMHNGVVRNASKLQEAHQALGINYHTLNDQDLTFNDSEALLWDMALYLEGKQDEPKAIGNIAFICVKKEQGKPSKLYFSRNYLRPLKIQRTKTSLTLASEGEGDDVKTGRLFTFNLAKRRLTSKPMVLDGYEYTSTANYADNACGWGQGYWPSYQTGYYDVEGKWHSYESPADDYDDEPQLAGNWLPDKVRSRVNRLLAGASKTEASQQELELEDTILELEPPTQDVLDLVAEYMDRYQGFFEEAYWALELDYEDIAELAKEVATKANLQQQLLYEQAMDFLQHDPEYTDEDSVSSIWGNQQWQTV